mmetsp:Transcript_2054/g.4417  ORF Transcript_2054/g.4417 Transcript_2054/m.4417 type:complete len:780 (-) Transcript_2054:137-2476(-)
MRSLRNYSNIIIKINYLVIHLLQSRSIMHLASSLCLATQLGLIAAASPSSHWNSMPTTAFAIRRRPAPPALLLSPGEGGRHEKTIITTPASDSSALFGPVKRDYLHFRRRDNASRTKLTMLPPLPDLPPAEFLLSSVNNPIFQMKQLIQVLASYAFLPPTLEYLVDLLALTVAVPLSFLVGSKFLLKEDEKGDEGEVVKGRGMGAAGNFDVDGVVKVVESSSLSSDVVVKLPEEEAPIVPSTSSTNMPINIDIIRNEVTPQTEIDLKDNENDQECIIDEEPNPLLTPQTYATSHCAESRVETDIASTASTAFASTDFAREPHLSPELDATETALETVLLAKAAHELVEAAEGEREQSSMAVLEREREMEWIESRGDGDREEDLVENVMSADVEMVIGKSFSAGECISETSGGVTLEEAEVWSNNDLKLDEKASFFMELSPQTDDETSSARSDGTITEADLVMAEKEFLSTTTSEANDAQVAEERERRESQLEWMESEVRAACMGGQERLPFYVASSAAASAAEHAMADSEADEGAISISNEIVSPIEDDLVAEVEDEKEPMTFEEIEDPDNAPVEGEKAEEFDIENEDDLVPTTASILADTAERMILGEDIAYFEQTALEPDTPAPPMPVEEKIEDEMIAMQINQSQEYDDLAVQEAVLSEVDQWRKEYIQEIRSYVQQKGIEQTKRKMSRTSGDKVVAAGKDTQHGTVDSLQASESSTGELVAKFSSENNGNNALRNALEKGLIRRMKQKRRLIIAAVIAVVSRRLVLAYLGKSLRLF